MSFRITGLPAEPFRHLFGLPDAELAAQNICRMVVDEKPGFPDRVSLREAELGEAVLLLNYTHQPGATPYRSCHAIFVREADGVTGDFVDEVPESLRLRLLSVRAFDGADRMVDADVLEGRDLAPLIARFFGNPDVAYLHVHNARRGCYAARVDRA